jgi:hypothetical protein
MFAFKKKITLGDETVIEFIEHMEKLTDKDNFDLIGFCSETN